MHLSYWAFITDFFSYYIFAFVCTKSYIAEEARSCDFVGFNDHILEYVFSTANVLCKRLEALCRAKLRFVSLALIAETVKSSCP